MKLANNREAIAVVMVVILFSGGVALLSHGITANKEKAFLDYLKDLVDSISGGNVQLEELNTIIEREPNVFIVGGGVLMFLGLFGLCSVISHSTFCRKFYVILLLFSFAAGAVVVILACRGHWGVDFNGENNDIRERFRSHWLQLPPSNRTDFEARLDCCDFDNASPRRNTAVWLGGCRAIKKGCFIELLLVENGKMMASVFIWATTAFVLLFFAAFNYMVDHARI